MVGNRDFLAGDAFLHATGMTGLADPTVLVWGQRRIVLSHGDALCLDDVQYQQFRSLSRSAAWRRQLLSQPLGRTPCDWQVGPLLKASSASNRAHRTADADSAMASDWLDKPRRNGLFMATPTAPATTPCPPDAAGQARARIVLCDWHIDGHSHRAEVLRITPQSWQRVPL